MIPKVNIEDIIERIDVEHRIKRLEQLADNATSEQVQLNANVKILEIAKVIKTDPKKTEIRGTDLQLVIEE